MNGIQVLSLQRTRAQGAIGMEWNGRAAGVVEIVAGLARTQWNGNGNGQRIAQTVKSSISVRPWMLFTSSSRCGMRDKRSDAPTGPNGKTEWTRKAPEKNILVGGKERKPSRRAHTKRSWARGKKKKKKLRKTCWTKNPFGIDAGAEITKCLLPSLNWVVFAVFGVPALRIRQVSRAREAENKLNKYEPADGSVHYKNYFHVQHYIRTC